MNLFVTIRKDVISQIIEFGLNFIYFYKSRNFIYFANLGNWVDGWNRFL